VFPNLSTVPFSKYLKTRPHLVADNFAGLAHTQTMSNRPGHVCTDPHDSKSLSPALLFGDISFALCSLKWPEFCLKVKKAALRLVQSVLNPFTISRIFQKSRRKNEEKRAKSTQIRPFSDLFRPFPALCLFAILSPQPSHFSCALGHCLRRLSRTKPDDPSLSPLVPQSLGPRWGGLVPVFLSRTARTQSASCASRSLQAAHARRRP
jgi:hypothetical protein